MAILVVGMHRSGTSAVANVLQGLGVDMGPQLLQADEWNLAGYFEDLPAVMLNDAMIRVAGGTWSDPPEREALRTAGWALQHELAKYCVVRVRRAMGEPWGFKDPRLCLTLGTWLDVIREPVQVVWVWRRRQDVVASLMRRAQGGSTWWLQMKPATVWLAVLETYMDRLQQALEEHGIAPHIVQYEELLGKRRQQEIEALAEALGLETEAVPFAAARICAGTRRRE